MKKSVVSLLLCALCLSAAPLTYAQQAGVQAEQASMVSINRASEAELAKLPGIGPKKAAAIIAYRNEHGEFKSLDDLQNVKGVGKASMKALKGKIKL